MIYLQLFWSFIQIGLFSIGGGYAAMPLIQNQVVDLHHWLDMTQFVDLITIAEMTPGPIAINSATFVGTQIAGLPGALIATLGVILPSCVIVITLAIFYLKYKNLTFVQGILKGLRPVVVALIASAGVSIVLLAFFGKSHPDFSALDTNYVAIGLFTASLLLLRKFKPNPIFVMMGSGVVGAAIYLLI